MRSHEGLNFHKVFKGKKIPILTLDERWYELFPQYEKPNHIKDIEYQLNELLKQQGKLVNDMKDLKSLKSQLMKEILDNMEISEDTSNSYKILEKNPKYIKEISEKMADMEEELANLPYLIKETNEKLIVESAKIWYQILENNNQEISGISQWIDKTRNELKEKILQKQDMELKNNQIYSYMHDLLGPDLVQVLDDSFKPGNK
jgi:predicted transcriptional regulator